MAWVWCDTLSSWVAPLGPVPAGYRYPVADGNDPDISAYWPAGGEVDIISADEAFDVCGTWNYHFTPTDSEYVNYDGTGWGSHAAGPAPAYTHLFVVVSGPSWDDTDPAPAWAASVARTWHGPASPPYEVIVVDVGGTPYGTLGDAAKIGPIGTELNGAGSVTITLPTTHADTALMQPGREVQIVDGDGNIVFWGPIVRPRGGLVESSWQCQGLLWYLQRRYFGRADRVNLLTNGDFEDGETGWAFEGGVGHTIDTGTFLDGAASLKLEGSTADHVEHASQTYDYTTQYHPLGDAVTAAAWVLIPSADYLGGALDDRGLMVVRRDAADNVLDVQVATIGDDTPKDEWVPLEAVVTAVHATDTVEVRLYPPHGVGFFDVVTATLMESLAFDHEDIATIVERIVLYAQDRDAFTHGKSDLNIDVDAPATGVTATRTYLFSEHRNIWDAIEEFVRQGVIDVGFVYTTTTRTLTVYHPARGSLFDTTLALDTNLASFDYSWDGNRAAGSVIVLGPGDGPDRPEGGAVDPGFLDGVTLELIESAPDDALIGELDASAADALKATKSPQILEVTTMPATGIIGALADGDTVAVSIDHGWVSIDGVYRVARLEVDCYKDQATLTLNVEPA